MKYPIWLTALTTTVPKKVLIGAAGALGAAIVTASVPWVLSHMSGHREFVGVFAQPTDDIAPTPVEVDGCPVNPSKDITKLPTHIETENWQLTTNGARLSAHVTSADGTGQQEVEGFDIRKNGAAAIDTITAAYKGAIVGRGNYYLNREYDGPGQTHIVRDWWRGYQVSYDCQRQEALVCPYVLGEKKYAENIHNDDWLKQGCRLEINPSLTQQANSGQHTGG